jgi:hypothetical protein
MAIDGQGHDIPGQVAAPDEGDQEKGMENKTEFSGTWRYNRFFTQYRVKRAELALLSASYSQHPSLNTKLPTSPAIYFHAPTCPSAPLCIILHVPLMRQMTPRPAEQVQLS